MPNLYFQHPAFLQLPRNGLIVSLVDSHLRPDRSSTARFCESDNQKGVLSVRPLERMKVPADVRPMRYWMKIAASHFAPRARKAF